MCIHHQGNGKVFQGNSDVYLQKNIFFGGGEGGGRVLKLSTYRLQIFLVKYKYLRSLELCEDQGIHEKVKNLFVTCACDLIYDLYGDQALSSSLALKMSNKEDFKDFEVMAENTDFSSSKLLTFPNE